MGQSYNTSANKKLNNLNFEDNYDSPEFLLHYKETDTRGGGTISDFLQ